MMSEEWNIYPPDDRLEASSHGRIRRTYADGKVGIVPFTPSRHGYGEVSTREGAVRRHVIVCTAFHGPCPSGLECCHGDGDRQHNVPDNLRWDTHKANAEDAVRHDVQPYGDSHSRSKLTSDKVAKIKRRILNGESPYTIVADYPEVTVSNLFQIKYGRAWRRIQPAPG